MEFSCYPVGSDSMNGMLKRLKRDIKLGRKGIMSKLGDILLDTIEGVKNGQLPLDTAEQIHLAAHRHVMDRYAEVAVNRQTSSDEAIQRAKELLNQV